MDQPAYSACVFVVGSPRSGTSALSWAVAQHPDFWTSAESDFILDLYGRNRLREVYDRSYRDVAGLPRWLKKHNVSFEAFAGYLGYGIDLLYLNCSGGKRWVEQSPSYTMMIRDLLLLFPRAKFLHAVRDGRRVVASMVNSGFPTPWAGDFKKACETWSHYALQGKRLSQQHPARILEVRNEDLVHRPEATCAGIFAFLEAPQDDRPAAFLREHWINSSFGSDRSSISREPWTAWSSRQKRVFRNAAAEAMRTLGYTGDV